MSYFQRTGHYQLDVDVEVLDVAKSAVLKYASQFGRYGDEFAAAPGELGEKWVGPAATAVKTEMRGLGGELRQFSTKFADAGRATDEFIRVTRDSQETVDALNRQREQGQVDYDDARRRAQYVAAGTAGLTGAEDVATEEWRRCVARLDIEFEDCLAGLRSAGSRFARSLEAATVVPVPDDVARAYRGGALPVGVRDDLTDRAFVALGGGLPLAAARHEAGWDLFGSQAEAEAEASRVAGMLADSASGGDLPPEAVASLERSGANRWFAVALMKEMGAAGVTAFPARVAVSLAHYRRTHAVLGQEYRQMQGARRRVVVALAGALTTASHDPALGTDFTDELVREAVTTPGAAFGLTTLMHRGGVFQPQFALRLAEGLYAADRRADDEDFWPARAVRDGNVAGAAAELFGAGYVDPLTGVAEMLARDPAAAQTFLLTVDGPGEGANHLRYLTHDRDWSTSDRGDALGHLVVAASTRYRDHGGEGSPGYRSAQIASQFLEDLPYGSPDDQHPDAYRLPADLRDSTGVILGAYINDVRRGLFGKTRDPGLVWTVAEGGLPGTQAYGLTLRAAKTPQLLTAVLGDREALRSVIAAQQLFTRQQFDYAAGLLNGDDPTINRAEARVIWGNAVESNSRLAGSILQAANADREADAAAHDARVKDNLDLLSKLSSAATSFIPLRGGPFTEIALGEAKELVFNQGLTDYQGIARNEAASSGIILEAQLVDLVATTGYANHLYHNGVFGTGGIPHVEPTEPGYFLDATKKLIPWTRMTRIQQDTYINWVDQFMPTAEKDQIHQYVFIPGGA